MKKFLLALVCLVAIGAAYAANDADSVVPLTAGKTPWGTRRAIAVDDAGVQLVSASVGGSVRAREVCVAANVDAGQYWDGGVGIYSTLTLNPKTTSFKVCNFSSAYSVRFTCDQTPPVMGAYGDFVPARTAGETNAWTCEPYNVQASACPIITFKSSTDMKSASDGGTGCVQVIEAVGK